MVTKLFNRHLQTIQVPGSLLNFKVILFYLSNKYKVYVNNYLFLTALLHFSMFIRHPQGVSYYIC